jgi:hypothetical protein
MVISLPILVEVVVDSGTAVLLAKQSLKRQCLQQGNDAQGAAIARSSSGLGFHLEISSNRM